MANDFDNDDLSWLPNRNSDQDDSSSEDDLPDFDWLTDEDNKSGGGTGSASTGLTGQLPWQQDRDDETPSGDSSSRLGVTGELDWRRARLQPDYESMFDGLDTPNEWASTNPDWETPEEVFNAAEQEKTSQTKPSAISGFEDEAAEEDVPDWLQGMLEDADENFDEPPEPVAPPSPATSSSLFDFGPTDEDQFEDLEQPSEDAFEEDSEGMPDWLLSAAPSPTSDNDLAETDDEEVDSLAGLFDDMSLDSDTADIEFDDMELDFEDFPAPSPYASPEIVSEGEDNEDDDLFAAIVRGTSENEFDDSDADEIAPPEVFSPEALQGFDDYSLLEALDAPDGSGTGATVSDDFFSSLLDDEDDDIEEREEFSFDEAPPLERISASVSPEDDSLGWMNDLEALDDLNQSSPSEIEVDSVDEFLASLGTFEDTRPAPTADSDLMLASDDIDFNRLLSDPAFADFEPEPQDQINTFERLAPAPDSPEWLADVRIQEVSASALVRQQQDRPVEELPSRLQALRERGLELPAVESGDQQTTAPLFEPTEANVAVPQGQTGQITLSPEQASKVALLRSVTHSDEQPVEARPLRRGNLPARLARIIAAVLIAGAVLIPFVSGFRIGNLPPSSFGADSQQQAVFEAIDDLNPRELVLFAAEYGGSNAGELDGLADVLLRHTILKGAVPVVISTNPIGLLRMDRNLSQISNDLLRRNRDYYIGRYIAGDDIGLRNLSQEIGSFTATDSNGRVTNLAITSLDDFAAIVVISGEAGRVRNWSEQVAPLTQTPLLFAVSASVSPIAQPYADAAGVSALLVGYRDSYTYADQLNGLIDAGAVPPLIEFDTETPTIEATAPAATATPELEIITTDDVTDESGAVTTEPTLIAPTRGAEVEATAADATPSPTIEVDEIATETDTAVEETGITATATATEDAAETVEPSPTSTPISEIDATNDSTGTVFGRVTSDQTVNVRSGPGTDFSPVGVLQPGERFEFIGENDDGTWVNVQLADGTRGWVFAQLVEIEDASTSLIPPQVVMSIVNIGGIGVGGQNSAASVMQQIATRTPRPTLSRTAVSTEEVTEEAELILGTPSGQSSGGDNAEGQGLHLRVELPYREERWYGMTLGIVVIVVIIVVGNIIGLLSRRATRPEQRDR
jgi:uncharacterized protein YraI